MVRVPQRDSKSAGPRGWRHAAAAFGALVLGCIAWSAPARADVDLQLGGAVRQGYTDATGTSHRLYTDVSPEFVLQLASQQATFRAGYVFAGSFTDSGAWSNSFSNQANASLVAQLSTGSSLMLAAGVTQGGTSFQLSQPAAQSAQVAFREAGIQNLVSTTFVEAWTRDLSPSLRLGQGLDAAATAPQDDLRHANSKFSGFVSLDRVYRNDTLGLELRPAIAIVTPLTTSNAPSYVEVTNALVGRWNHDFNWKWNAQATAGAQQVLTLAGTHPVVILPSGSLTVRYQAGKAVGMTTFTHGEASNLQTGTISVTDQLDVRGVVTVDALQVAASAGVLHAQALNEAASHLTSGTGNAVQGDLGVDWKISGPLLLTARYSAAYQFGLAAGIAPSLVHVALVGLAARYNSSQYRPTPPSLGGRVDGTDAVGIPGVAPR